MSKQIHFSVDDTFGCFHWLDRNRHHDNIFYSSTFDFAKYIYETYGIGTTFYCMYTDGEVSLDDFQIRYSDQFQECCEWMKFGFHCYDNKSNYSRTSINQIDQDYTKVICALEKITGGGKCLTDILRLHYFAGNDTAVKYLKAKGINRLLCADDDRGSYNLSADAEKKLKLEGIYRDTDIGMDYLLTHVRVENVENVKREFDKIESLGQDNIVIFTHEGYLRDMEIKNRVDELLKKLVNK